MIRDKISRIYGDEPSAKEELQEVEATSHRSPHQEFMYKLGSSGKDLATIQTEWHEYYKSLDDTEKHKVWQEFYSSHAAVTHPELTAVTGPQAVAAHKQPGPGHPVVKRAVSKPKRLRDSRSASEVQDHIKHTVTAGGKLKAKHHLQSLLFGLSMGFIVIVIFLFSFFNEVVIAPFIQPSRASASTPLIVSNDSIAPTDKTEVIIPKINVEIPVNYTQTSTNEADIEKDLDSGVVHYPTTVKPGELGNTALFGHSSNNIFNKGKYKFAFVLLHTLVPGDTFYLTYNGKVYVYKVISRQIVEPSNVAVLGPVDGQTATATLITCDPPGTSLHRLVVVGQQISPDPSGNTAAAPVVASGEPISLPGNGPTLWSRMIATAGGKIGTLVIILVASGLTIRWILKPKRR
jgi:LPXTG-site transpeptidase (sortase) family protein